MRIALGLVLITAAACSSNTPPVEQPPAPDLSITAALADLSVVPDLMTPPDLYVPTCTDGIKNGNESDVDCGGVCGKCANGLACGGSADCQSGVCTGARCQAPTCADGVKNGNESDTDCGGTCPHCGSGKMCSQGSDCGSSVCASDVCSDPSCTDGAKNGTESDVDCGGNCTHCTPGKSCGGNLDCDSGVCTGGKCMAPVCTDGVKNADETDIDCGGSTCPKCAAGKNCKLPSDCTSTLCANSGVCTVASCSDGVKNGNETDIDCGGAMCPVCGDGKKCGAATDCNSRVCNTTCSKPTCSDGVKNGNETDTDCGGSCGACADGKGCAAATDCTSGVCGSSGACAKATCSDGVKNGGETDIDCGGTTCSGCATGKACAANSDCSTMTCTNKLCAQAIGQTQQNPGLSCADIAAKGGAMGDNLYWVKPDSNPAFQAWCDMTTVSGLGFTRVFRIALGSNTNCGMSASSMGDPSSNNTICVKYSDAVINELAPNKIFYSKVNSNPVLFTHYDSAIRYDGPPGKVVQSTNYTDINNATPNYTPQYSAWVLFHQQNWYNTDRCFGAQTNSFRLSLEYLSGGALNPNQVKYACTGNCAADCPMSITSGTAEVYVR